MIKGERKLTQELDIIQMRKDITKLQKTIYPDQKLSENHFTINLENDSNCDLTILEYVASNINKEPD